MNKQALTIFDPISLPLLFLKSFLYALSSMPFLLNPSQSGVVTFRLLMISSQFFPSLSIALETSDLSLLIHFLHLASQTPYFFSSSFFSYFLGGTFSVLLSKFVLMLEYSVLSSVCVHSLEELIQSRDLNTIYILMTPDLYL